MCSTKKKVIEFGVRLRVPISALLACLNDESSYLVSLCTIFFLNPRERCDVQGVWLGEIAAGIKLHDVWKVWNTVDSQ